MPIPFCVRDRVTGKHCWEDDLEPCTYCVLISALYHQPTEEQKEQVYAQDSRTDHSG